MEQRRDYSPEWKDVNFGQEYDEVVQKYVDKSFFDVLHEVNDEFFTIPKSNRSYGYRVLRSIDNGVNWADLTSSNGGH